jgi:3-oxoacyl-[acyl-carrier protein] reductase
MVQRKVAIVTGGGRGIGKGISLALGTSGMAVAVIYHRRATAAEETVVELRTRGGKGQIYQANVAIRDEVLEVVRQVRADFGRIDVLVNNAGVGSIVTTANLAEEEWDRVLAVNLKGAFLCSQAVLPAMRAQIGGRIINITSIAGQTGGRIGPHYAASKAGLIGLTRFMARELGSAGITVNAIAPAGIQTDMLRELALHPAPERPVSRAGVPEDVAAAVQYLVSEQAGFITGQVLSINGGSFIG